MIHRSINQAKMGSSARGLLLDHPPCAVRRVQVRRSGNPIELATVIGAPNLAIPLLGLSGVVSVSPGLIVTRHRRASSFRSLVHHPTDKARSAPGFREFVEKMTRKEQSR